ncbi:MAG TPA: hypothetical protein VH025_10205 [Solirubrobacteraceae bacterium]|nr:hypothetical protein [Solirubrobacteraceae bacterium]
MNRAPAIALAGLTTLATMTSATTYAENLPASAARVHFACSGPNSAKQPCRFATPSGNIRCLWTPKPNRVECVLTATGRAYRLSPKGHAMKVVLHLSRSAETLPKQQQIVFPQSMSCSDMRTTMRCNQDFGSGAFVLVLGHSHAS